MIKTEFVHTKQYLATGTLTNECYEELQSFGTTYVQRNGYAAYLLGMTKDELSHDAVVHLFKYIDKYNPAKSSLKTYITRIFKHYTNAQIAYQNRTKRKHTNINIFDENGIEIDLMDHYSFVKSLERNLGMHEDQEFVNAVLFYWTLNVNDYFYQRGKYGTSRRLNLAKKIISILKSGQTSKMTYTQFCREVLRLKNRQSLEQVLRVMRTVNKRLWDTWLTKGSF
jgi:hypothetical protein